MAPRSVMPIADTNGADTGWPLPLVLQSTALATLALGICMIPRLVPWLLTAAVAIYAASNVGRARKTVADALMGLAPAAVLALPAFGLVSTLWSADRSESFEASRTALVLVGFTLFLTVATRDQMLTLSPIWQRRFLRGIALAGMLGVAFLLIESLTGNAITRRVLSAVPGLAGARGKGLRIDAGQVSEIAGFFANRNVAGLALLGIPVILSVWLWLSGGRRIAALGAIVIGVFVVVFRSESETAKLALVAGALTIALASRWPARAMLGLGLALAIGLIFTLTLARLPIRLGLQDAAWLPASHRDRVLIWDANAEIAETHPLLGAGVEASRILQQEVIKARKTAGAPSQHAATARRPAWHAHNFYLQARVDLGFVGSLALLALGIAALVAASGLHPVLVPWGYGLVAATMAAGISGWGLWQYWFIAGLGADVIFLGMLDAFLRRRETRPAPEVA